MKGLVFIIAGVLVLRTFEPTFDIIGFWPVFGVLIAIGVGLALVGAGILGMIASLGGLSCDSR